ncbi:MAG: hypothetical protein ACM36A_19140 [Bacteroidota bacterium]
MKTPRRPASAAIAAAVVALAGGALALERVAGPAFPGWIGAAYAQDEGGGHGGGGESGGGHGGGGESGGGHGGGGESGGGHGGGGMGGGHNPGEETGGEEAKGHGTRYQHQGHGGGQHGQHGSAHQAGGDRFGGGSGLHGNNQVPEGVGRYGANFDALSAPDQGRFRYWGGWSLPEDVGVTPTTYSATASPTTSEMIPGPGSGPSVNVRSALDAPSRCEGIGSGMTPAQQFSGGNLQRLNAARGMVDPALAASGKIGSPYLMGSMQSELVKEKPNTDLAGTYLGLIAKVPVTAATVKSIGSQLCATVSDAQAQEIARVAEQQRTALSSAARANGGGGK